MSKSKFSLACLLLPLFIITGCEQPQEASIEKSEPAAEVASAEPAATTTPTPAAEASSMSDVQKLSYALGVQIGQNMIAEANNIEQDVLLQGLTDAIGKTELKLSVPEMEQAVANYQAQDQQRQQATADQNLAAGIAFLVENKKNTDVTETASGLQYKVLTKGTGPQPKATDSVVVHYRGTFIDGSEFDSSYSRGEPITISLDQVIPAWQEVVPMMPVGSKWQVFIPSSLGYGEAGSGPIGPNSTLVFDVELLSIGAAPEMTPVP
jgi:FKBP-type peptidyl-prolyl cis-trans isomerase